MGVELIRYDEVPFHGGAIPAALAKKDGREVIAVHVKATCDRLGIDYPTQFTKIKDHPVWSKGIGLIPIPSVGGAQGTGMLELRYWLLWLANIDPRRVNEESADLLIRYQEEAADVLEAHFMASVAQRYFQVPQTLQDALRLAADALDAKAQLEAKLIEQAPMVNFANACLGADSAVLVRQVAKIAKKDGIEIGQNRLYDKLREWGLVMKESTEPTQRGMESGYFEVIQRPVDFRTGTKLAPTTKVTPAGQKYIINRLIREQREKAVV